MARAKNYRVGPQRMEDARARPETVDVAQVLPVSDGARIDMVALLGANARFARESRTFDFSNWLGRGIDLWVWATVACLRAMLLSGARQTATVTTYALQVPQFLAFLTEGRATARVAAPADLAPLHIETFIGWLQQRVQDLNWSDETARTIFRSVKSVVTEMFAQGFIPGEPTRFFRRASLPKGDGRGRHTSFSDAEQERLAQAIRSDLVAAHQGRLMLSPRDLQAMRLLLVAHRQGANLTPLLELQRDAMAPGLLPGTIRIRTVKYRNKTIKSGIGRALPVDTATGSQSDIDMVLPLAEAAVLQQAVSSSAALLNEAPAKYRNRVWLYRLSRLNSRNGNPVVCLSRKSVSCAICDLIKRHQLLGDDGRPLRLNVSRLRKSFFERALRIADGDLAKTANLLGNTPQVAAVNYPSMNDARQVEAAKFMNEDYLSLMAKGARGGGQALEQLESSRGSTRKTRRIKSTVPIQATPVSGCADTVNGEHAPRDGKNHCDRYVMCVFCSSFAIVGTVQELWRLFSFQAFARAELAHLDATLGPARGGDEVLEELRDRYRLAIAYIDDFTGRQFSPHNVSQARVQTEKGLHPFWKYQLTMSRRARGRQLEPEHDVAVAPLGQKARTHHGRR